MAATSEQINLLGYLGSWFEAMELDRITLVLHDWGTALGFDRARRHLSQE